MNVLIVDDELYSVQGIVNNLPWRELGFEGVFEAYSCEQAKGVFRSHEVDLIICDIEMPKGSGIELMEWVRENGFETLCIFLTSYSKFEYASQAIRLQAFDYILKPAEYALLEKAVRRGAEELDRRRTLERQSSYWVDGYDRMVAQFWSDVVTGAIPAGRARMQRELENRHLDPVVLESRYYLTYIQILPDKESDNWDRGQLSYAVTNVIGDILRCTAVLRTDSKRLLVISEAGAYTDEEEFGRACGSLANTLHTVLPAEFLVYYGRPCLPLQAEELYQGLMDDAKNSLSQETMVFLHGSIAAQNRELPALPKEDWQDALYSHNTERILRDISGILYPDGGSRVVDRALLSYLFHGITDVVYDAHAVSKTALPGKLFVDSHQDLADKALDSIPDFLEWAEWFLHTATQMLSPGRGSSQSLMQVQKYIREHLDEEINRTVLAQAVHLNPDYLSYLFRERTGGSLSEYINRERIVRAKHLLANTDLPIHQVAIQSGFSNISYFSKQFKRSENQTPFQYRKTVQRNAGGE